jgi:hypothetical protein
VQGLNSALRTLGTCLSVGGMKQRLTVERSTWHNPTRTRIIGIFFLIYFIVLGLFRYQLRGIVGFYELWYDMVNQLLLSDY